MGNETQDSSADLWLHGAYDLLVEGGIAAVRVMPLARRIGLTRTGFYWHFADLSALHGALLDRWEETNTGNLVSRTQAPAGSVAEAMLNVFDCWFDPQLFDAPLDLAIRNWARTEPQVQQRLDRADSRRIGALHEMFSRFGTPPAQAEVSAMTVIYTQIGYISMRVRITPEQRLGYVPHYVRVFTGTDPSPEEIAAFRARHLGPDRFP